MHVRYVNGVPVVGGDVIAVEGVDNIEYKSVCRKCWKKLTGFDSKIFNE
jgi:thymidine kinase